MNFMYFFKEYLQEKVSVNILKQCRETSKCFFQKFYEGVRLLL